MDWKPDTPPDGDFARYVEQLSARAAAAAAAAAPASSGNKPAGAVKAAARWPAQNSGAVPTSAAPAAPAAGWSFGRVLRWLVLAWITLQILSAVFPRASAWALPLLLALAAWAAYAYKTRKPAVGGALLAALRRIADEAHKQFNQRK